MLVSSSHITTDRLNRATRTPVRRTSSTRVSTAVEVWDNIECQLQQHQLLTEDTTRLIIESLRPATKMQYATYIIQFMNFIEKPLKECTSTDLLSFLSTLYHKKHLRYSAVNTARSAVSTLMDLLKGEPLGQHHLVKRFMKGVFHQRPSLPKYQSIWDPDILLNYLDQDSNQLTTLEFSRKIATLLTLLSGNRVITIASLKTKDIHIEENRIILTPSVLGKTSKPGKPQHLIEFNSFQDRPHLCIVNQLKMYLSNTKEKRKNVNTDNVLLTTTPPYHNASRNTIANWIKTCLNQAGINNNNANYSPHSLRAASTSKASSMMPVDDILKAAGWSSESTFHKFYKRSITPSS